MNIFNKLSSVVLLLFGTSQSVGKNITQIIDDKCIKLDYLLLCNNVNSCPDNYHICNTYDNDILLKNENYYKNISETYFTNIGSNNDKCELCKDNQYNEVITIEPLFKGSLGIDKQYCMIDNKRIKYGYGVKLTKCISCICGESETRCINTCNYNRKNTFISTVKTGLENCIGLKKSNTKKITCLEYENKFNNKKEHLKNLACCVDNACYLRNCKSCMNYGNREMCNECDKGYYFNTYSKNKCHGEDQVYEICGGHYSLDEKSQTFSCLKCVNGVKVYNNSTERYRCVCNRGFYGNECEKNYDLVYCSGNGVYDINNKYCICDGEYEGIYCKTNIFHSCLNGVYNKIKEGCICDYGFTGTNCEIKIHCIYGDITNGKCICRDGFSGNKCDIPFTETSFIQNKNNAYVNSFNINSCKNGLLINNTCSCFNGFTGIGCGKTICKNGNYDLSNKTCICVDGYYGKYCELDCFERCSYNGNICGSKNFGKCLCNNGWYGDKCDIFQVNMKKRENHFSLTSSINISYITNGFNFSIKMLENKMSNTLPFKVNTELNMKNNKLLPRIRNLKYINQPNLIINTTIGLNYVHDNYYIYPNNDYNLSYNSGKIINITHMDNINSYYIYVEQPNLVNITSYEVKKRETDNNFDFANYVLTNYWTIIICCLLILTVSVFIITRVIRKRNGIQYEKNKNLSVNRDGSNKTYLDITQPDMIIITRNALHRTINHKS